MKCQSFYPALFEMTGVKFMCEREHADARSWHQYTNEKGQRTQWSWSQEERDALKNPTLWWHVYAGEVPDLSVDPETGERFPGWGQITLGEATKPPEDLPTTVKAGIEDYELPYLASFDHNPTERELEAITPWEYGGPLPEWREEHDQDAECSCGHPYYRHFDTYEDMLPVGCKYCECMVWESP